MKTKRIVLFYNVTQKEVVPPAIRELERKDNWIKEVQKSVPSEWESKKVKVIYELFDPEIENQRRFFNGTIIKYYAIQNEDMYMGEIDNETVKRYREEILDEMLGYDLALVTKTVRKRKSTSDFKSVQAWSNFINLVEETIFENAGYIFPSSEEFNELKKKYGHEKAEELSINKLQDIIRKKCETNTETKKQSTKE